MKTDVVIVGAGPSGIATAACLNSFSILNIVIEKEDCIASLWKNKAYDRLKLHLAKQFCSLPLMPHSADMPTFIPKDEFIRYLDDYTEHFMINPVFCTEVVSATFSETSNTWSVINRNKITGEVNEYMSNFLIVATGENSEGIIPEIPGLESFPRKIMHSSLYKSGARFAGKRVLGGGVSHRDVHFLTSRCLERTACQDWSYRQIAMLHRDGKSNIAMFMEGHRDVLRSQHAVC